MCNFQRYFLLSTLTNAKNVRKDVLAKAIDITVAVKDYSNKMLAVVCVVILSKMFEFFVYFKTELTT